VFLKITPGDTGEPLMRIRGLGILDDPNEVAQFLILVIPFFWLQWESGRALRNVVWVIIPTIFFIVGIFMTHSRGGMVALIVILLLGMKDRFGLFAATITACISGAAVLLLNFSGGRPISMAAGADRMEFWANGLQLFKSAPVFGIGFGNFVGQNGGHTAHNSFVLCLAELGLVGYMCWVGLLVSTFSGINSVVATFRDQESAEDTLPLAPTGNCEKDNAETVGFETDSVKWAKMLRISLAGFLVAAWFLSRAYAYTLYIAIGMAVAVCQLEPIPEDASAAVPFFSRLVPRTALCGFGAIVLLYVWVRAGTVLS